jgi:tetratricopeptide (TPR) repeat protein
MKTTILRGVRLAALLGGLVATAGVSTASNPQAWLELRSPNFLIITNANENEARTVAVQFETIRAVAREHFGNVSTSDPVIIVAAKDEATLKILLPEFWEKRGSMHPAGIFLNGPDKSYVGLRLDVSMNQSAYEPYEPIYHEYYHYLMRRLTPRLPLWMVEGLAEFYGNTRIETKNVFVGDPSTSNIMILRQNVLLPLSTLFEVNASSPYYHEQSKTSIFYAESWALTHYLIARDWREKTQRLKDFTLLLLENVPQTEAARRTIGDPGALEGELSEYIHKFSFTTARLDRPKIEVGDFRVRQLSDAESLAVRADFMAHHRHYAEARQMLEESLKLDPKLAGAYEGMGFLCFQLGKIAEAGKWYSEALAINPQSYLSNFAYAESVLQGTLNDDLAVRAESSLRAAIKINPNFAPAYDHLAYLLALSWHNQNPEEAHMMALHAVALEPGNISYRLQVVQTLERMGRTEDAIRVATLTASMAKTPADQGAASASLAGALYNTATAHVTGEGGESVDFDQALDLYHKVFDMGKNQCEGAYAALRIAKMVYFTGVRRPSDDDPVAWVQKSYEISGQVEASLKRKNSCDGSGARVEEFLYRLSVGERRDDLLRQAIERSDDDWPGPALKTAIKYFSGSIDEKGFEAGVEASKSERDRCYAYFEGMWYAEITKESVAAANYYKRLSEVGKLSCQPELVFAKKFTN